MTGIHNLEMLQQTLQDLSRQQLALDTFCRTWREQADLLTSLPPRYAAVMEDLLGRLETGSQFSQESCSYSQEDLLANLADWLTKARQTLATQTG